MYTYERLTYTILWYHDDFGSHTIIKQMIALGDSGDTFVSTFDVNAVIKMLWLAITVFCS